MNQTKTIQKPQKEAQTSSTSTDVSSARINRLFARLSAVYGHIWQSQFKSEGFLALAKKEWEETLREFEDYSINLAINTCRKRHEMPPTLPMLYQLCRSFQPLRVSQYRVPDDGLPTNPAVLEKYNQIIAEKLAKKSEKEI